MVRRSHLSCISAVGAELPDAAAARGALRTALAAHWNWAYGPLGDLDADLEATRAYFDPARREASIRDGLAALSHPPREQSGLEEPLAVRVATDKWLISPEGRLAIDIIDKALGADEAAAALGRFYRRMSRRRLHDVVALLAGGGKPMQLPAVGLVLALIVNGHTSASRAVRRRSPSDERDALEIALLASAEAFASSIWPSKRRSTDAEPLFGGWPLNEATRRLPQEVVVTGDGLHVLASGVDRVIAALGVQLARRRRLAQRRLAAAFDDLEAKLATRADELDVLGAYHVRPRVTSRTRSRLLAEFNEARASVIT